MKLKKLFTIHWLLTLVIMTLSALLFGLSSYNIFHMFHMELLMIYENGHMAVQDGAVAHLCWLSLYGILSVVSYLLLKICEKSLVDAVLK